MPANPFHYGTPATGPNFAGRSVELAALLSRMRSQVNVVVVSPRRYGKTSLILRATEILASGRPRAAVVSTNVFLCKDLATLAGRLVTGLYRVPGGRWHRARSAVPDFLGRLRVAPTVSFDADGTPTFAFAPGLASTDADTLVADVYAGLAQQAGGRAAVLVLDEFQAITRHAEHLPRLLKGLADQHPSVCLVLAGSRRHLMERLVTDDGAPLYGMAQRLAVGPIPDVVMLEYLSERADAGGRPLAAGAGELVIALAGPVPNDIQHLAFEAFDLAGRRILLDTVRAGLERAVSHESDLFAERLAAMSPGQARVAVSLASDDPGPIFSASFARTVALAGGQSVKKAIDALADDETVVRRDGHWVVADPFFAAWLRQASG